MIFTVEKRNKWLFSRFDREIDGISIGKKSSYVALIKSSPIYIIDNNDVSKCDVDAMLLEAYHTDPSWYYGGFFIHTSVNNKLYFLNEFFQIFDEDLNLVYNDDTFYNSWSFVSDALPLSHNRNNVMATEYGWRFVTAIWVEPHDDITFWSIGLLSIDINLNTLPVATITATVLTDINKKIFTDLNYTGRSGVYPIYDWLTDMFMIDENNIVCMLYNNTRNGRTNSDIVKINIQTNDYTVYPLSLLDYFEGCYDRYKVWACIIDNIYIGRAYDYRDNDWYIDIFLVDYSNGNVFRVPIPPYILSMVNPNYGYDVYIAGYDYDSNEIYIDVEMCMGYINGVNTYKYFIINYSLKTQQSKYIDVSSDSIRWYGRYFKYNNAYYGVGSYYDNTSNYNYIDYVNFDTGSINTGFSYKLGYHSPGWRANRIMNVVNPQDFNSNDATNTYEITKTYAPSDANCNYIFTLKYNVHDSIVIGWYSGSINNNSLDYMNFYLSTINETNNISTLKNFSINVPTYFNNTNFRFGTIVSSNYTTLDKVMAHIQVYNNGVWENWVLSINQTTSTYKATKITIPTGFDAIGYNGIMGTGLNTQYNYLSDDLVMLVCCSSDNSIRILYSTDFINYSLYSLNIEYLIPNHNNAVPVDNGTTITYYNTQGRSYELYRIYKHIFNKNTKTWSNSYNSFNWASLGFMGDIYITALKYHQGSLYLTFFHNYSGYNVVCVKSTNDGASWVVIYNKVLTSSWGTGQWGYGTNDIHINSDSSIITWCHTAIHYWDGTTLYQKDITNHTETSILTYDNSTNTAYTNTSSYMPDHTTYNKLTTYSIKRPDLTGEETYLNNLNILDIVCQYDSPTFTLVRHA